MPVPLTRRRMLRGAALGVVGALLAACTGNAGRAAPTATDVATTGPTSIAPSAAPSAAPPAPASVAPTAAPPTATGTSAPQAATSAAPATTAPATVVASPSAVAAPSAAPPSLAATMAVAARRFLDSLNDQSRQKATYPFADEERVRWHWTTPSGFPRNGLPLKEMSEPQRAAALALLRESASAAGYQKALDIMALQRELGSDPLLYYATVFGEPGGAAPWGWRFEGHHLSRHFTVVGERVAMTPFFLGAWPTITDAKLRAMPREEDAARDLVRGLAGPARDRAIFQQNTLTEHVTQNRPVVAPLAAVGIPYGELPPAGQALATEIIETYLGVLHPRIGDPLLARIRAAGIEQVRFGWAGATEPRKPQYYRLQGPTFLLEFDNSRNGGTHIHSVWRDFVGDFGRDLG